MKVKAYRIKHLSPESGFGCEYSGDGTVCSKPAMNFLWSSDDSMYLCNQHLEKVRVRGEVGGWDLTWGSD